MNTVEFPATIQKLFTILFSKVLGYMEWVCVCYAIYSSVEYGAFLWTLPQEIPEMGS